MDFEAGNFCVTIWEEETQSRGCSCDVSKFSCDEFNVLQMKDFAVAAKVLPEEAQCVGDEFWWHFEVHALIVDDLAKDA